MDNRLMEGEVLFADGKIEDAERFFLDYFEEDAENPEVLNNLGVISHARGNLEDAEGYFLKAIGIKEDYSTALFNLANLYYSIRDWERSVGRLEKCVSLGSQDCNVYNLLGTACLEQGNIEKARKVLLKSLEINPNQEVVKESLEKLDQAARQTNTSVGYDNLPLRELIRKAPKPVLLKDVDKYFDKINLDIIKQNCKKVLIVMDEGIGNMVMLGPTIKALKEQLPDSKITILGRQPSVQLLEGWDLVEKVLTEPDDEEYDIAFLSIWSNSYEHKFKEKIDSQCKIVFKIEMDNVDTHESKHHFKIAGFFGYEGKMPDPSCEAKEVNIQLPTDKIIVALSDTAQENGHWERKRWPHYKKLSEELIGKGYAVVLIGGNEESRRFKDPDWPSEVVNCLGKYDIQETAGILKKCNMFIGNDSGPAHMAAALGIPTFVLFGPSRMSKNMPIGPKVKAIRSDLGCIPCQYTERWKQCENWRCMSGMTIKKVLPLIIEKEKPKLPDIHLGLANDKLKLVGKDYSGCRLIEEDNVKYLVRNGVKEALRIHLVGAGKANYPWGMENEIVRALKLEGIEVVETDYRLERENFTDRFMREAHFMLVCKGSGIPPDLIQRYSGRTLLWYQDDVFTTQHAPRDLAFNGRAFDTVYTFDKSALNEYQKFGIKDVRWLPLAMSPTLHRKMNVTKKYDISFVGNIHPNRGPFFERLAKRFNLFVTRAFMDDMVQILNQSKIVLNLGIGPTGIQQRVFEALGCGAFLLTNEIPVEDRSFEDKKHLVYFNDDNIEELIEYYLEHGKKRSEISEAGYVEVNRKHTFKHRIKQVLNEMDMKGPDVIKIDSLNKPIVQTATKQKKWLLVFWHGIGDNIMAIPALRAFRRAHPGDHIGFMYLKRIHKDRLMDGCPYIDDLYTCSDAWDDYPDYETGMRAVIEEGKNVAKKEGYDEVIPITLRAMPLTHHRIERIAYELGVKLDSWDTELWLSKDERIQADHIWSKLGLGKDDFVVALHRRGANVHKYWEADEAQKVIDFLRQTYNAKVIAFETHTDLNREPAKQLKNVYTTADLETLPLKVSAALIDKCKLFIGLDSGPMWISTTTKTPIISLFTMTWMHQSAPVRENSIIVASQKSWEMATDDYKEKYTDRILKDPSGGISISADTIIKAIRVLLPYKKNTQKGIKDILEFIKNCYSPVPFEGYNANAVRDKGSHKRWQAMFPLLPTDKQARILDIGCNLGFFSFSASKAGHKAVGIDTDGKLISYAKRIAETERVSNVQFYHLSELVSSDTPNVSCDTPNLLDYLKTIPDDEYDFVFYLSVHHHIYEQFDGEIADQILLEISRISKNMIFDMGQPDEKDSGWMPWLRLVPKFHNSKIDIITHVTSNSRFEYGEVISSTKIHGIERWLYSFSRKPHEKLSREMIQFGDLGYLVDQYIWRGVGSLARLKSSAESFPVFDPKAETKIRYYQVHNYAGKRFFVKEKLYNYWLNMTPEEAALNEYERGQKVLVNKSIRPYILAPIAVDRTFLLFDYCDWHNLFCYADKGLPVKIYDQIIQVAKEIRSVIGDFDFNPNNILYQDGHFKFIDFEYAECDFKQRMANISRLSENAKSEKFGIENKELMTRRSSKVPILKQPVKKATLDISDICPLCGGPMSGPIVKDLIRCDSCGAFRKENIPSKDIIKQITKNMMLSACFDKDKEKGRIDNAHKQIDTLEKYIKPGRVYDVGAAAGFFMKAAQDRGWVAHGNEISVSAIEWAKVHYDIDIDYGLFEDLKIDKDSYDAVVLWNTLEHVINPVETINFCKNILKDDGLILIEVPEKDEDSLSRNYEEPHITEFNRTNLVSFMKKTGFDILEDLAFEKNNLGHLNVLCRKRSEKPIEKKKVLILPENYHNPNNYWAQMLTLRCNAGCPYCILNGRGKCTQWDEMSGKEILDFWNNVQHRPGQRLSILGGEPTLHPDVIEIINNLEGYHITITTNCRTPFYKDPEFYKRFKPHSSSTLRINTTFHPHHISPEEYIRVIELLRKTGYFVDQTSFVYTPDVLKYAEVIKKVSKNIKIRPVPYLGFYDKDSEFNAPFAVEQLKPNENYYDVDEVARVCGLPDLDAYRDMCGAYEKRQAACEHPMLSLIVGPNGDCYHCHYKMYYGIDPVSNIKDFKPVDIKAKECRHYGFCNWCDVPRVGCAKNPTAKQMVLNKLRDDKEFFRPEIQHLITDMEVFAKENNLDFDVSEWFEYAYALLYSGHRHNGNVLNIGINVKDTLNSIFTQYLIAKGYKVEVADNKSMRELKDYGQFDLIVNFSNDLDGILDTVKYLKQGGVLVFSKDGDSSSINTTIMTLEKTGLKRLGLTDYGNSNSEDVGIACLRKSG